MPFSYKCSISFGLIYIPVTLHASIRHKDIGFHMLDRETMSRIKYQKTCVDCDGQVVNQKAIVKGYEYERGKYVVFEEADFEKLKTEKDKNITIEQFTDLNEIDPIYYEKPYYVAPAGAEKAFALLMEAMQRENKVGIAKAVLGQKETLIAIRAKDGHMLLNTLVYHDEVQKNPAEVPGAELDPKELALAVSIISGMTQPFEPAKYKDEYRERVQKAIESKVMGQEIVQPKERNSQKIINLMDALEASLKNVSPPKAEKPAKKRPAKPAEDTRARA